ncbi:exodeoxyribonuclease VII small subunit [Peptococcus simiae]|uniref:Exodeoxyribonuclease 7 small subunit n=1 Tax=Peptococcus simiae TaxID=1643805 RepID=A0ABW9GZ05_9FIRM
MNKSIPEDMTFEAALGELDAVLNALEKGDIPLEDALAHYQWGMDLAMLCQKKLDAVEEKIKVLQPDGSLQTIDEPEGDSHE